MPPKTRTAFFLSALLHVSAVLAIVAIVLVVGKRRKPPTGIFELVAGPGTSLTATEAPARGTPAGDTVSLHLPKPPPPPREPVRKTAPPKAGTKPAPVPPRKEAVAPKETKPAAPPPRMSYEEYVKKFGAPKTPSERRVRRPIHTPRIDVRGIVNGVLRAAPGSRSTEGSGGNALTAAQHAAFAGYMARLVTALRQNLEKPPGLSDLITADLQFDIAADGSISRVHVVRSSGDAGFDRACLEAFRRVGSIGPTPDGESGTYIITFRTTDE